PADAPRADQSGGDGARGAEPGPAAAAAAAGDDAEIDTGRTDSAEAITAAGENSAGLRVYGDSRTAPEPPAPPIGRPVMRS
ncbi:MAG: hypothetical protein ACK5M9_05685, partial [Mycobacterium sp.]